MTEERRRHPRIELLAQVQLSHAHEVHTLSTLDVSLCGLFVLGSPGQFDDLEVGASVDVVLYPTPELADAGAHEVRASARIARVEPEGGVRRAGFGLELDRIDNDNLRHLAAMINKFTGAAD